MNEADSGWDDDIAKRSVSIRLDGSDIDRVKAIARRLRVRESEVYRFAIKNAIARLAPLQDPELAGASLMPVFVECGAEIAGHFNLDARRLDHIINGEVHDPAQRVAREDIELLAMSGVPNRYLYARLREIAKRPVDPEAVADFLRDYLNEKYVLGDDRTAAAPNADGNR
ncbi:MAG: hypothetical protein AB7Q97_09295 [Gammaproteobacteria bacterium]